MEPPLGQGPITFTDGKDNSSGAQIRSLVDRWNNGPHGEKQHVTFVELPESTDEHRAQLLARAQDAVANGKDPDRSVECYDVMMLDVIWTAQFAQAGYIRPLDTSQFELDAFLDRPIDTTKFSGMQWAMPARTDVALLYYRKDILDLESVRPPRTWGELARQAEEIAPKYGIKGYVAQFAQYEGFTVNALEAIWAGGGEAIADDGSVVIDSDQAKAGIDLIVQGFGGAWIPADAINYNEERSRDAFQQGNALFMRNWPYVYQLLNAPGSPVAGKFEVAALPGPSALGGWNLAISQCSTNLRTAYDFIKYLTGEESQQTLFENAGFAPSRRAPYLDPGQQRLFPYADLLLESLERARSRPVTPYYNQISSLVQEHLQPTIDNNGSLDAVMESLADELRAAQDGR